MILLAADTSGKQGSIALAKCEADDCLIVEVVPLTGGAFSAELVPLIAALLSKHGISVGEVGGFAVATGPGSFTGLRVGLAAIKALSEVLGKPIAGVSLLEAVAAAAAEHGPVQAVMDAGRAEVFAGNFEVDTGEIRTLREELIRIEELSTSTAVLVATPDETLADGLRKRCFNVKVVDRPRSDSIARLGWRKLRKQQTTSSDELDANYIRRSDAEIFAKS